MSPEAIVLTLIAAFAGGALSTTIADSLRRHFMLRSERTNMLSTLHDEVDSWVRNMKDLYGDDPQGLFAQSPIANPSLSRAISSDLFAGKTYAELRRLMLSTFRAANAYNAMYEFAVQLQAGNLAIGRSLRQTAANFAHQTLLPRLHSLENHLRTIR